jgi:hypothetical protein
MTEIRKVAAGERPLLDLDADAARTITGPATIDGVAAVDEDTIAYWRRLDARRREKAPWLRGLATADQQ